METSSTQRSYVDDRDICRAKADAMPAPRGAKGRDLEKFYISEFAKCMQPRGWAVPGPDDGKKAKKDDDLPPLETARAPTVINAPAPVVVMQQPPPTVVMMPPPNVVMAPPPSVVVPSPLPAIFGTTRESQCAYARHARHNSSIAKDLAADCDAACKRNHYESCPKK